MYRAMNLKGRKEPNDTLELRELKESLKKLTPSVVTLKEELKRLRTPKLSTYEKIS